ncbi:hypothetical protein HYV11_00565 [Candidatus Dependentiae bacterium]|nr:hypothetical protein [Candidatus Dependentiae bacterium]
MRILYRGALLGMLLFGLFFEMIPVPPMIAALEKLQEATTSNNQGNQIGQGGAPTPLNSPASVIATDSSTTSSMPMAANVPPPPSPPSAMPMATNVPPPPSSPPSAMPMATNVPPPPPSPPSAMPMAANVPPPPSSVKPTVSVSKVSMVEPSNKIGHEPLKGSLEISDVQSTGKSGLDTINIDSGGNWLEKRIWFKKAEMLFDEIRILVTKVSDMRTEFVDEVNSVGKKIDLFYEQVSFEKGQIDEVLKQIVFDLSQNRSERGGDLSSQERQIRAIDKAEQKQIEQIGNDIKKVDDFDAQIDKAMMQAFKTIDDCRKLEGSAWKHFKSIGSELDDKKARTLYYEMENVQKNIEQNIKYLQATLLPYVRTKLIAQVEQIMTTIQAAVKLLDQKGIHLEALVKKYTQADNEIEQQREEEAEKSVERKWEQQHEPKPVPVSLPQVDSKQKKEQREITWYEKFSDGVVHFVTCVGCTIITSLQSLAKSIYSMAPGFFNGIIDIYEIFICYLKCIFCAIRSWICKLF